MSADGDSSEDEVWKVGVPNLKAKWTEQDMWRGSQFNSISKNKQAKPFFCKRAAILYFLFGSRISLPEGHDN